MINDIEISTIIITVATKSRKEKPKNYLEI